MKETSFKKLHSNRREFLKNNSSKDHVVVLGNNNVLISAPHGVSQIRLGFLKHAEIGSLASALFLQDKTNSFLIAKTKNNYDDANFDEDCNYRKTLRNLIEKYDIKYVIDLHGLAKNRACDVNLGTHLGKNIEVNLPAFESLKNALESQGFIVFVDQPFMAGSKTISSFIKKTKPSIWSLQIEINCAITNQSNNFEKYKLLLKILTDWMNALL